MIRTRVTDGILHRGNYHAEQMRALAEITCGYGRDLLDFTTRQQVKLRWIRINDFPEIFKKLRAAGLDSRQTGMDNIRGVTTCPVAGLAEDEVVDIRDLIKEMTDTFVGDWRYANLPRKFNITIIGFKDNCTHSETNGIGSNPAVKDGVAGFNVRVGGGEVSLTAIETSQTPTFQLILHKKDRLQQERVPLLKNPWGETEDAGSSRA